MYKMLIVDDEFSIREGLKSFDWASIGIEVNDTAENGLMALWKLQHSSYEIILTDIRMPIMDGLQLVSIVAREYPMTKIIVLTVHSDFEYVRTCLRNGVDDFFVKPLEQEELFSSLKTIISRLDKEKEKRDKYKSIECKVGTKIKHLRYDFITDLINRPLDKAIIEETANFCEMIIEEGKFTVGCLEPDKRPQPLMKSKDIQKLAWFGLDRMLSEAVEVKGYGYHILELETFRGYIIFTNSVIQEDRQRLTDVANEIRESIYSLNSLIHTSFSWGIGQTVDAATGIYVSANASTIAIQRDHVKNDIIFHEIINNNIDNKIDLRLIEKNGDSASQTLEVTKSRNCIIDKVLDFIHLNFVEHITLADLANLVHVHPNYLSGLFKEITGRTFSYYLMEYRIIKAKELLCDPVNRVAQVGRMVGYEDAAYFTRIFKQITSLTPFEYKNYQQ